MPEQLRRWPMSGASRSSNMINRRAKITQAPYPGRLNGVLPAAPRGQIGMLADYIEPSETFVACPNQDVVYGLGFFSLDEEPVVIQLPDFAAVFGSMPCATRAPTSLAGLASPIIRSPASICWSVQGGAG